MANIKTEQAADLIHEEHKKKISSGLTDSIFTKFFVHWRRSWLANYNVTVVTTEIEYNSYVLLEKIINFFSFHQELSDIFVQVTEVSPSLCTLVTLSPNVLSRLLDSVFPMFNNVLSNSFRIVSFWIWLCRMLTFISQESRL